MSKEYCMEKKLEELAEEINFTPFDVIMVSAGTGGTATGILKGLDPSKELWVFSSLKRNQHRFTTVISSG